MKVAIVSNFKDYFEKEIKKEKKLILSEDNPDVVIAFGGEGTFLYSEKVYPGAPKVFVAHSSKCKKCKSHDYKKVVEALANNKFKIVETAKIHASIKDQELIGLNEINIHYNPPCAIRFDVEVNKKTIAKEAVGDGIIISTPYGSSGYFHSITRKGFRTGIGLAFNNPVEDINKKVIPETSIVKVKIVRGPGILCSDCNKETIPLETGDVITIQKHSQVARILKLEGEIKVRI